MIAGETGKRHLVARNVFAWVGKVSEKMLVCPGDPRALHGLAIREVSPISSLGAEQTAKSGGSSVFTITLSKR